MKMPPFVGPWVGKEQLGQGEYSRKHVIRSHILKLLLSFSGEGKILGTINSITREMMIHTIKEVQANDRENALILQEENPNTV